MPLVRQIVDPAALNAKADLPFSLRLKDLNMLDRWSKIGTSTGTRT